MVKTEETTNLTNDVGGVSFKCPNCLKAVISRTGNDRQIVAAYKCPNCGFEGPN